MYVIGRTLYRQRLTAVYLFVAALFMGEALDATHSDQNISILLWVPWALACGALFHRHRHSRRGAWYLNLAVLFTALGGLDLYPHFQALAAIIGVGVYLLLYGGDVGRWLVRYGWRLWPSGLVLAAFGVQLAILRLAINFYRPGLRADAVVDPSTFGSTGLVQLTSLLGSFAPLVFLSTVDRLAPDVTARLGYSP